MSPFDPEELRSASRESWEAAAGGWGRRADRVRDWGMAVSAAMIEALDLHPGERVLELAAGPGDTGFMAAQLISPGGTLISSDGAEAMIEVARERARDAGVLNIEFRQLELEWIDLPTASVDAVLCRWGIMLTVDPEAAAREMRRVLRSGGRAALAVWDEAERNPWATVSSGVMVELGHLPAPEAGRPGPFALGGEGRLADVLLDAGFTDVEVSTVSLERRYVAIHEYVEENAEFSPSFGTAFRRLGEDEQVDVAARIAIAAQPFTGPDGSVALPGSSLVARAQA